MWSFPFFHSQKEQYRFLVCQTREFTTQPVRFSYVIVYHLGINEYKTKEENDVKIVDSVRLQK